ncbi:hypothetical protein BGP_1535 [Beggiatoa sp. PS]|nr:hypothetical protein BGP_1535 [Beggiatoa sp. PS]
MISLEKGQSFSFGIFNKIQKSLDRTFSDGSINDNYFDQITILLTSIDMLQFM